MADSVVTAPHVAVFSETSAIDFIRVQSCQKLRSPVGYAHPRCFRTHKYVRGIATKSRVVVQQACRDEVYLLFLIGVGRRTSARLAEAGMPPPLIGDMVGRDIIFAFHPAKASFRGIENGIAVGSGHLAALRAVTLPRRSEFAIDDEAYFAAKA